MKRGFKITLVAMVAIVTHSGLHSAFGWRGHAHCKNYSPGHGPQGGCGHYRHSHHHDGFGGYGNCADPYNLEEQNNHTTLSDTLKHP